MRARTFLKGIFWWSVTIVILVIFDDLLFGPFFWSLALVSQFWATVAAFLIPIATQQWLIRQGVTESPNRFATVVLKNLFLERKSSQLAAREESVKAKATHYTGAALVAPIIGGVLPTLLLYKAGYPKQAVLRFSWVPTLIYAAEYAFIHGGWGIGGIFQNLLQS